MQDTKAANPVFYNRKEKGGEDNVVEQQSNSGTPASAPLSINYLSASSVLGDVVRPEQNNWVPYSTSIRKVRYLPRQWNQKSNSGNYVKMDSAYCNNQPVHLFWGKVFLC